jgi:hypothetical protein
MRHHWLPVLCVILIVHGAPAASAQEEKGGARKSDNDRAMQTNDFRGAEHYYCRIAEMPISWQTRGQPVDIMHSDAVFTELGTTIPALDIRNTQRISITNIAFVLEYLDGQGQTVTTAAIAAAAAGHEKELPLPFSVENIEAWKKPLERGRTARVSGFYDSQRTVSCPKTARVTFAMVRFGNGTVQQYPARRWSVPPLPRVVPELSTACPLLRTNPTQIRAKVRINSTGNVIGFSGPTLTTADADLIAWVATQMKHWTFHPAVIDGRPEEDDLNLEFVLYGDPEPNFAAISLTTPATLVWFSPKKNIPERCQESFGFLAEATTIP